MDTNVSNTWWDSYHETVKVTKRFRQLVSLVGNDKKAAQNMIDSAKQEYPGKSEMWYLNTLIAEQSTDDMMGFAY